MIFNYYIAHVEIMNILRGSFHAKSTNFEQKSDMTIFAEICCNNLYHRKKLFA